MKALKDFVVVAEVATERRTDSGLIITADLATGAKPAKIIDVGPLVNDLQIGDVVAIKWGEALAVSEGSNQLAVIHQNYVCAKFDQ
jgi:co-chaperonin GroES (HSP10)